MQERGQEVKYCVGFVDRADKYNLSSSTVLLFKARHPTISRFKKNKITRESSPGHKAAYLGDYSFHFVIPVVKSLSIGCLHYTYITGNMF